MHGSRFGQPSFISVWIVATLIFGATHGLPTMGMIGGLRHLQANNTTPSPTNPFPAPSLVPSDPIKPTPKPVPVASTPTPTSASTPTVLTPHPTEALTPHPTEAPTPHPTEAPTPHPTEAPTLPPTSRPTTPSSLSPTPVPTSLPTLSDFDQFCADPVPDVCVEKVTDQDRLHGAGAFYDLSCNSTGGSEVGCDYAGLCVFNRDLYSRNILGGDKVPYIDCPCCVPEVYGKQGDINCDFEDTPSPTPAPGGPVSNPSSPPFTLPPGSTLAPTGPDFIRTAECENGPGTIACTEQANPTARLNGVGVFYEEDCEGFGCNILGLTDCRECIFDPVAFANSGGNASLGYVDCPCCVPLAYNARPESSDCVWPAETNAAQSPVTLFGHGPGSRGTARVWGLGSLTVLVGAVALMTGVF